MKPDILGVLRRVEWSGTKCGFCPGMSEIVPMHFASCPVCGGVCDDLENLRSEHVTWEDLDKHVPAASHGHARNCPLKKALESEA